MVAQKAKNALSSFQEANRASLFNQQASPRKQPRRKPAIESYKANWDVAISSEAGKAGMGAIIRDHRGCVMGTLHASRPTPGSVFDTKSLGLLLTVLFCKELGITNARFEGDSQMVINKLCHHPPNWSIGGLIIEDVRFCLASQCTWAASHVLPR